MGCLLETHPALGVSTGWAELCLDILEGAVVVSDNFVSACGEEKCSLIKAVAKMREIFSAAPKLGSMRKSQSRVTAGGRFMWHQLCQLCVAPACWDTVGLPQDSKGQGLSSLGANSFLQRIRNSILALQQLMEGLLPAPGSGVCCCVCSGCGNVSLSAAESRFWFCQAPSTAAAGRASSQLPAGAVHSPEPLPLRGGK